MRIMSPHLALPTSPMPSASGILPTLRGFSKWSMTFSPEIELTDNDGVTHRLWIVTDEAEISAICKEFDDKKLYIADGHHRYETALNYRNYCHENKIGDGGEDYVMMMLVDMEHEGLVVFPTHRIVRDLESFDAEKAEKLCEEYFYVEKKISYETIEKDLRTLYDKKDAVRH